MLYCARSLKDLRLEARHWDIVGQAGCDWLLFNIHSIPCCLREQIDSMLYTRAVAWRIAVVLVKLSDRI